MKVKDLIQELNEYNLDAEILVTAHCKEYPFTLSYGGAEGVTKNTTNSVHLYVDELCTNEVINENLFKDMREQFNEMTIFNVKLTYLNKFLLGLKSMNISKTRIIEICEKFDSFNSIKDVKEYYKTLLDNEKISSENTPFVCPDCMADLEWDHKTNSVKFIQHNS